MTTLATLRSDIGEWLSRSDVATPAATMIRMVEAEIARRVRHKSQERSVTITVTGPSYNTTTDHPSGDLRVLKVISLSFPDGRQLPIQEVSPVTIRNVDFSAETGRPRRFAQEGFNIIFAPRPTATTTSEFDMVFFQRFPELVLDTDTNDLLTQHYDLYLNGALRQGAKLLQDWEAMAIFQAEFDKIIREIMVDQNRARRANNFMGTRRPRSP